MSLIMTPKLFLAILESDVIEMASLGRELLNVGRLVDICVPHHVIVSGR